MKRDTLYIYAVKKSKLQKQEIASENKQKREVVEFSCYKCDYVATQKGILKMHKQSKHEGVRYPCDKCYYVATQRRKLVHTQEI